MFRQKSPFIRRIFRQNRQLHLSLPSALSARIPINFILRRTKHNVQPLSLQPVSGYYSALRICRSVFLACDTWFPRHGHSASAAWGLAAFFFRKPL